MRFTPVRVCAKTYQRPSSSAKLRKYVCPFASNCNFNLPLVRKNASKKQATDFTDFHRCCPLVSRSVTIRVNPWPSSSPPLFLVLYIHVLCIDYAFVLFGIAVGRCVCSGARTCSALRRLGCLVHLLSQLVRGLGQRLASLVHGCFVAAFERFLRVGDCVLDVAAL